MDSEEIQKMLERMEYEILELHRTILHLEKEFCAFYCLYRNILKDREK